MPSGTQLREKQYDFGSPSNVDNFDGIENGGG